MVPEARFMDASFALAGERKHSFLAHEFLVKKKGLKLWKNVTFRYTGQISHTKPNLAFGLYYPEKPNAVFSKRLIF